MATKIILNKSTSRGRLFNCESFRIGLNQSLGKPIKLLRYEMKMIVFYFNFSMVNSDEFGSAFLIKADQSFTS